MTNIIRINILSILSIIILMSMFGCVPSISQKEYDSVRNELSDVKGQVAALQEILNEAMKIEAQYYDLNTQYEELNEELKKQHAARIDEIQTIKAEFDELNTKYEQLKGQDDARINEIQAMKGKYDELNKEFEDLKRQYDTIVQGTAIFSEEEINQAVFELINKERNKSGVDELVWGINLYGWAIQNSREMAAQGKIQYSSSGAIWQDVFWATRYGTVDQIANAALITWKVNDYSYKHNIISAQNIYGAVATHKSGEVYYITYIASIYR